jgi:hypothetical protein
MGLKINSVLAVIIFLIGYYVQRQRRQDLQAREQGCQPVRSYRSFEPLSYSVNKDVPSICRFHDRYGKTFQVSSFFALTRINTIAPENIQSVNASLTNWGNEPFRRSAMEYFCGPGFITCDGAIREQARRMLRPTFQKCNISDFTALSREMDTFMSKLPADGVTVDLQPLFFLLVSKQS